jgi:hypothetical protein
MPALAPELMVSRVAGAIWTWPAAAVLAGLAVTAARPGGWWIDPVIGLALAAAAVREGIESWQGNDCC